MLPNMLDVKKPVCSGSCKLESLVQTSKHPNIFNIQFEGPQFYRISQNNLKIDEKSREICKKNFLNGFE